MIDGESSGGVAPGLVPHVGASAHAMDQLAAAGRKRLRTLEELVADATLMAEPQAVLPKLAYGGRVTLLSAREKYGKSTLLAQAAVAVTTGGLFLGERIRRGKVLWYALDEPFKDAVQRLHRFGADPTQIVLPEHSPSAATFEADCAEWQPSLVVIDTLSRLLFANDIDLMNGRALERFLQPYLSVIQACGAALVLLHHTNRKGEEYTGSIHLGAIVDGPLTLKKSQGRQLGDANAGEGDDDRDDAGDANEEGKSGDGRRLLVGQTRWGAVRIVLEFNLAEGRYVMYTLHEYVTARITEELASTPGLSGNEIIRRVGAKRTVVQACIRYGEEDGRWYRKGTKWFPQAA